MRSCRTGTRSPDSLYFSVLLSFAFVHEYRRDLLSELFNDVQVGSTLYGRLEARAPWAVAYPDSTLAGFHVVLDGECWLHLDGDRAPVHLVAGDFVVLPHGTPRELRDSPTAVPFDAPTIMSLIARNTARVTDVTPITNRNVSGAMAVQHIASIGNADSGLRMEYLCGAFTFTGDGARPLLSVLPDVIHVPGEKGRMMPWLESHLQAVACELTSGRPGASMVIARLSDVLFVQAVDASRTRHAARSGDLDRANRGAGRLCVGRCIYCRIQAGNRQRAGRVAAAERGMTSGTDSGYKPHFTANRDSCMDLRTSSHTSFIRSHRVLAIAVALGLMACTRAASAPAKPPVDATEYAADTKAWRVKRLDAIAGPFVCTPSFT